MARERFIGLSLGAPVAELWLNRPEKANAYHGPMLLELERAISVLERERKTSVVLISARGRSFCGGADLKEMRSRSPDGALFLKSQALFERLARLPKVTIAAIQGPAIAGGMELALACDLRIATPDARFALPETSLGIIPAAGGTLRLKQMVGSARAKDMILGGRELHAADAEAWGLVSRVVSRNRLMEEGRSWAERLGERDGMAMALAKDAIDLGEGRAGLRMETLAQAFLESRLKDSGST